jgi:hypothetical protein
MRADRRWRTRKEKKEWARRLQSNDPGLDVIHPQAAGIDIGNASHYVRCVRIEIRNQYAGSSVSRPICIGWRTG